MIHLWLFRVCVCVCVNFQIIILKPHKLSDLRKLKPFSPGVLSTPHLLPVRIRFCGVELTVGTENL